MSLFLAGAMFALTILLLLYRRRASERSVVRASALIAVSMLFSDDELYYLVDTWAGGQNIFHVLPVLGLNVGMFFLARGASKITPAPGLFTRMALSPWTLVVSCVGIFVSWCFFDVPGTALNLMADYGDQLAVALYSMFQYVYFAAVLAVTARGTWQAARTVHGIRKAAAVTLAAGSAVGVVFCADVLTMDVVHLVAPDVLWIFQAPYWYLQTATFLLLIAGIALTPVASRLRAAGDAVVCTKHLGRTRGVWECAVASLGGSPLAGTRPRGGWRGALYRRVVEIRDADRDPHSEFTLSGESLERVRDAEMHLLRLSR